MIEFSRVFALPNKNTFKIPPIKKFIKKELNGHSNILDLFPYPFLEDALERLRKLSDNSIDFMLYDPPYSNYQMAKHYEKEGVNYEKDRRYFKKLNFQICRVISPNGKVIRFGWQTNRIGKCFKITKILLVHHGSIRNDTIVTVQQKILSNLTLGDLTK